MLTSTHCGCGSTHAVQILFREGSSSIQSLNPIAWVRVPPLPSTSPTPPTPSTSECSLPQPLSPMSLCLAAVCPVQVKVTLPLLRVAMVNRLYQNLFPYQRPPPLQHPPP